MSGIAAIICFDGGAVEPGAIAGLTGAMAYRGPDGISAWTRGSVSLGHCMMRTTAESLEETQPLANEDASVVLVMDGWLANWTELREELLAKGARLRTRSDAELVLRAYETWGEECPRHLDGEFAIVLWDARRQAAVCVRDHAGLRPLHYHWDGRRLVVASDIAGVLAAPGIEAVPNRGMMAEIMANEWLTRDETIWVGVKRLLQAQWVRFDRAGMSAREYWSPPLEVTIRYKRDEDYVEHYRELFADCVRRASRSHLPVACDVSGGLDSSAIFAMAHDLRRKGRLPAPGVKGYTYIFAERGGPEDEIEYARAVARHVGEEVREIPPFMPELAWFEERAKADRDIPPYPNGAMAINVGAALSADGCRVSLCGEGGDEWLTGRRFYYNEQLAARQWSELRRTLWEDIAACGPAAATWWLVRFGLAHLLPRSVLDPIRRTLSPRGPTPYKMAFWLAGEDADLLAARRSRATGPVNPTIPNLPRRLMLANLVDPFPSMVRDHMARQSARIGYEVRFPMYARQFIEFCFATPERTRLRGKIRKHVHVQAMAELLPDVVRDRRTKGEFSVAFARQLDRMQSRFAGPATAISSRMTSPRGAGQLYDCYLEEPYGRKPIWELWGMFGCGFPRRSDQATDLLRSIQSGGTKGQS